MIFLSIDAQERNFVGFFMTLSLTEIEFRGVIWTGQVEGLDEHVETMPEFRLLLRGEEISRLSPSYDVASERFELKVPIPSTAVGNGSNSLVVCSSENDDILAKIHVVAGNILDHEIVAELQILREELDLLKKAFRRHASGS